MRSILIGALLCLCAALTASAEDFTLNHDGYGPINVHATLVRDGSGERLTATAKNDGPEIIPAIKMCVVAKGQKGCLFLFWNETPWAPGAELNWNVMSKRKISNPDAFYVDVADSNGAPSGSIKPPAASHAPISNKAPASKAPLQGALIQVQVVSSQQSQRQFSYTIPGRPGVSNTNCNGNATAVGTGGVVTANGTENCSTVTTPATPARVQTLGIQQVHVAAVMPDGRHITLWCQRGFRRCMDLSPDTYEAEIDGNALWIHGHELNGKLIRVKYQYVGGW